MTMESVQCMYVLMCIVPLCGKVDFCPFIWCCFTQTFNGRGSQSSPLNRYINMGQSVVAPPFNLERQARKLQLSLLDSFRCHLTHGCTWSYSA